MAGLLHRLWLMPHLTQLLKDDHKRILGLLTQIVAARHRATEMRSGIAREIAMELEILGQLETELIFPELSEEPAVDGIRRAQRELLRWSKALAQMDPQHEKFNALILEVVSQAKIYLELEERDLFPILNHFLDGRDESFVHSISARREELLDDPKYAFSRPETVQDPNGGEQKRKRPPHSKLVAM